MPAPRNAFPIFNMPEGERRKGRRVGAYGRGEERGEESRGRQMKGPGLQGTSVTQKLDLPWVFLPQLGPKAAFLPASLLPGPSQAPHPSQQRIPLASCITNGCNLPV